MLSTDQYPILSNYRYCTQRGTCYIGYSNSLQFIEFNFTSQCCCCFLQFSIVEAVDVVFSHRTCVDVVFLSRTCVYVVFSLELMQMLYSLQNLCRCCTLSRTWVDVVLSLELGQMLYSLQNLWRYCIISRVRRCRILQFSENIKISFFYC